MSSPAETVRAHVALADRLRRRRDAARHLWRAMPVAAGACALFALVARWAGWPAFISLGLLGVTVIGLAGYAWILQRDRAIPDAAAADIDAGAGMGGELRSAHWFSAADRRDPWVDLHLTRAAARLQAVEWAQLYPPVRAHRAKAATAIMAIGALALALTIPSRDRIQASALVAGRTAARGRTTVTTETLPPDIQKQLEELLKAAENGTSTTAAGRALTAGEARDLLSRLDKAHTRRSADDENRDMNPTRDSPDPDQDPNLDALEERTRRAAEMTSLSPKVRDALSEVADKLAEMKKSKTDTGKAKDPSQAVGTADSAKGDAAQSNRPGSKDEASIQAVKDASAGGGVGMIMMSNEDGQSPQEPGLGLGGGSETSNGGGRMPDLAAALRHETVEAHAESAGEKIDTDIRRKTERATATVQYSSTPSATFDRSRATAPPAVPESRRAAVQTYFIRNP
jgi:hypothetical protein